MVNVYTCYQASRSKNRFYVYRNNRPIFTQFDLEIIFNRKTSSLNLGWSSISVLKVQWNKRTRWLKRSTKFSLESYALLYQGQLRGKSRSFFQVTDVTVLHKWNPYRRLSAGANPEGQFGHVRRCANSKKQNMRERETCGAWAFYTHIMWEMYPFLFHIPHIYCNTCTQQLRSSQRLLAFHRYLPTDCMMQWWAPMMSGTCLNAAGQHICIVKHRISHDKW